MSTSFFQFYSLTQRLLLKAWFPYDRYNRWDRWEKKKFSDRSDHMEPLSSDRSDDHWDRTFYISAIATIAGEWFPYDRCDRGTFFFSAIIVSIRKPRLSYASYSCFFFRNEKRLLSFVSERIKLVYRINNTRYNFPKLGLSYREHCSLRFLKPLYIKRHISSPRTRQNGRKATAWFTGDVVADSDKQEKEKGCCR